MQKKPIYILLIILGLASCQTKETSFAFSEDDLKMVDVLVDVYTIDAATREINKGFTKDSLKSTYFKQVFQIHQIDSLWLDSQNKRLVSDPVRMDSVYSRATQKAKTYIQATKK